MESPNLIFRDAEDRDLVLDSRAGNVDAYNVLISRWEKRVFNYLLRLVRSREDAMDLSQDAFLKAYQNLKKLDDPGRFGPWLFRIAHNEAYSMLRKNRPEIGVEPEMIQERPTERSTRTMEPLELSLAVERALNKLSHDQREAVLLKVYQGFKFEEMAEILDCPVSTIKSRVYAALENLKAVLAPATYSGGVGLGN
jgi:RNA polymerase sigma-70 factor, ECF subfamily